MSGVICSNGNGVGNAINENISNTSTVTVTETIK